MIIFNMMNKQRSTKDGISKDTTRILLHVIGIIFFWLSYHFHWFLFTYCFLCLFINNISISLTSFKAFADSSVSLPLKRMPIISFNNYKNIPSSWLSIETPHFLYHNGVCPAILYKSVFLHFYQSPTIYIVSIQCIKAVCVEKPNGNSFMQMLL